MSSSLPITRVVMRAASALALLLVLGLFTSGPALAQAANCSDFGGVLDGFAGDIAPSQLTVDMDCRVRNYPDGMDTNFSFFTQPGQNPDRWLIIFDNVNHTGEMSCNAVHDHLIWFVNGSLTGIRPNCQNWFIPVEKIDKQNPVGQSTAAVGVPFTYTLTSPILFDAGTGTVINDQGSPNDLHSVVLTDDLNATGADMTYVSHTAYWRDTGDPVTHNFSDGGGFLTFDGFPIIPAGEQIVIELTVVLDNSTNNVNGTTFFNTAKWEFGRLIDGDFYEPLPGEWGITPPMTIAGPELILSKTGPDFLNLGETGVFTLDVRNIGDFESWNVTIDDELPLLNGATSGGMCDFVPVIQSAQVFAADGVTPVPGKGPLTVGTDLAVSYTGAPQCDLQITVLTAAGTIGADERLIIEYQSVLDADTENGVALTNVAGATQWFNADASVPGRQSFTRTLTNGTPGTLNLDHEDSHTVIAALFGSYFNKTVTNVTSGQSPATTASPGDTLRYALQLRTTDSPLTDIQIVDDLGALNPTPVFEPGTLAWVQASLPVGANIDNTSATGGANGTGYLDIRNLNVPADGEITIEFEVQLAPIIPNGSVATNQATLTAAGAVTQYSDDPYVNGQASPDIDGDEDPTQVQIVSAPYFDVDKISTYPDGDPTRLLAGERLRYTITVANIGTDAATDATIRDQIPANTTYVAGSTTLNGVAVADPPSGIAPLANGIPINAPSVVASGSMPADPDAAPENVATIEFEVLVDPDVVDGTIISNQAFVSAVDGGISDQPSDDPRTEILDDPTRDVVGNLPLLYAEKSAALEIDLGTPNVVDPGDTLRYTITVYNNGPIPATQALLRDAVPTNSTYVADSTTINGEAYGADGGVSPLIGGLPISSADLTPPLPIGIDGTLSPGQTAVIQFDVLVDAGVPAGTRIVNQATVSSYELPQVLTDGDGNPATGPEPTVVIVGPPQQVSITKQVAVVGGGPAYAGSTLEYTVRVLNIGQVPANYVQIYDDLDVPVPGYLTYVPDSATMNGSPVGVVFAGSLLTADYAAEYGALAPGGEVQLRFRAVLDTNLQMGTIVTNTAEVQWADPTETLSASVSVTVGGIPGAGILSGSAWHDVDFDDVFDSGETALEAWFVELYQEGELVHTTETDDQGFYRISGIPPSTTAEDRYEIVFRAPDAGASTAALGRAFSDFTNGLQRISDIAVEGGSNLADLHLPIDPNGVVYNAIARAPLPGSTLTMLDAVTGFELPPECFDDPAQQDQVTRADGFYKFDINFSDVACAAGGDYLISVTPPPSGNWIAGPSQINPPTNGPSTAPLSVPGCLQGGAADAIPVTTLYCEATTSALAPPASVPSQTPGTAYYLHLTLDNSSNPGSRQIFNNHIPLDPDLANSVTINKTSPVISVRRGDLVPYIITVTNDVGFDLSEVNIVDRFPVGFRYVEGSARLDGTPSEPVLLGSDLIWNNLALPGAGTHRIELLLAVGSGVSEGDFVNRAQVVHGVSGNALSSEATATVRLVPDPDFDCTDVMGKVFNDENRNGLQDNGEAGIPSVRLVTANGLAATTDAYGRYHITCATVPNESRGSNFVMKLDDRTLPSGFRASRDSLQIARATRGKALRFNFGASIHRVISIDLSDPIFEVDQTEFRPQWRGRLDLLMDQLHAGPAVLRISYLADLEEPRLVERRLDAFEAEIRERWEDTGAYELEIEPEIFWRRGEPAERGSR